MKNNTETKIWNATLYLRLSRDDGDKEESNSITGQRELLRDFIRNRPELREYAVRIDDGFTGSNFERPDFKKMMEDVKEGRTNCIIVKDLSRFGRNYLDAGEYIEKIFPFLGVRFIAVNDNYDSLGEKSASDDLVIPFKNLINEAYCRDISVKVRTQLEIKRKSGQYIGAFAVYGYMKDDTDKNRLVVDEYAADIVRDIFAWKLDGMSPQDIAIRLNQSGILSPMEYKKSLGMKFATSFKANAQAAWSANSVLRILKNPVYIGVLTQGKETTPSYKVRKRIIKPEDEWAVIPDSHEPIVRREDFETVQKVLTLDTRRSPDDSNVQLFSGMVFCGECGASMVRKTVPSGNKKYVYYVCSAHKQDKSCSSHGKRDKALEEVVLETVKQYIRDVIDLDDILSMTDTAPLRTAEAQKVQRQLDKKRSEHERLQKLLMSLYENLADGIIDRDEYARLKQNYSGRAAECEKQMDALQESLVQIKEHGGEHREWMTRFRKHQNITDLERSIAVALIDRILIYKDNRVEVHFRFEDEFAWQMDILRRSQIREVV
ncbi:recombinase [Eubacterium sp. am_0171]|uniref:recombinase family protein n=1 Tax=unclassified Eubacterium (in: firmicutes) TaxID=2624479 RepID=UPI00101F3BA5|nr:MULTISPECIES: recombinase family protein [unclassified Eubacterium (in: firmicutes)]MSC82808.1 recombinase [Eubacterium sp. BIOML-A1]MSD05202.1 recombinase [Eubacterium sp. BIOML-A2]RYT25096.1 recombinase [Eubacterium sp. am_0171]